MTHLSLLVSALLLTLAVAIWGIIDPVGLGDLAARQTKTVFESRGWFVMITASVLLLSAFALILGRRGDIKIGRDDDEPEFSTISWLTMMFAAGMGVGLLFYGASEPVSHLLFVASGTPGPQNASDALFITIFHWGLHAWAIYGMTGLIIGYFAFRCGTPQTMSAPIRDVFGGDRWTQPVGWLIDLLSIYAIAIGLAGSVAMGVFQVRDGISALLGENTFASLPLLVFAVLVVSYMFPLTVDLGSGMGRLSNTAIAVTVGLMLYILLVGPTSLLMDVITDATGTYFANVLPQGFRTYPFFDEATQDWFGTWTLNYMVWWLAWSPFVGVFIARISRGRTIREFLMGVLLVPTVFSLFWFGVLGAATFSFVRGGQIDPALVRSDVDQSLFLLLDALPLTALTTVAVVVAAFLFLVTSVVSAAYVLAMFSTGARGEPSTRLKLIWGAILGALALAMILSDSVSAVRQIIGVSAGPFVFIVLLLLVCFVRRLRKE
ncbi:MAG: BCCT family transporter [Myxococcota bacterium]